MLGLFKLKISSAEILIPSLFISASGPFESKIGIHMPSSAVDLKTNKDNNKMMESFFIEFFLKIYE